MKIAMIGLGKLGLPVSCAMALAGHQVYGYDVNLEKCNRYRSGKSELYEPNFDLVLELALDIQLRIVDSMELAIESAEIIFIAVPTPSTSEGYFDTSYAEGALQKVAEVMLGVDHYQVIAVISTVLPETMRNQFFPLVKNILGPPTSYGLCYNAQFIAMGSVIEDFLNPEFMLIGEYDKVSGDVLEKFYRQINPRMKLFRTTLENAEIIKMAYNTFIGLKIVFANTVLEICDIIPNADCDVVANAFSLATDRLISDRYLTGGMGDGGPCHPRDQRALDWLAQKLELSANPFSFISEARELQMEYIADVVLEEQKASELPVVIMGLTFKPNTNLLDDSPSLLLARLLIEKDLDPYLYDPVMPTATAPLPDGPLVYILATQWPEFTKYDFKPGSVIVDPWRMLKQAPKDCMWRPIGVGP